MVFLPTNLTLSPVSLTVSVLSLSLPLYASDLVVFRRHYTAPSTHRSRLVSPRTARSGGTSRRATGVSGSTGSILAEGVTPVASTTTVSSSTSSTLGTSERCAAGKPLTLCWSIPFLLRMVIPLFRCSLRALCPQICALHVGCVWYTLRRTAILQCYCCRVDVHVLSCWVPLSRVCNAAAAGEPPRLPTRFGFLTK